ncbi:hypothetical protein BH09MYX1_BH09MYX1_24720 [soil metagenome]
MSSFARRGVFALLLSVACASTPDTAVSVDAGAADGDAALDSGPSLPPFTYSVSISDPNGTMTSEHAALQTCVETGLDLWGAYLTGIGTLTVEIAVTTTSTGRFAGASASTNVFGNCKNTALPCKVGEDQAIRRLRTGQDNPGALGQPDVRISVTSDYWNKVLWMDPDPKARTADVPVDRDDAISVCTHELGHAFGMAGYRDLVTYVPRPDPNYGTFMSLYDDLVEVGTSTLTFNGPKTVAEFGPVPLSRMQTTQNVYHYGNKATPTDFDDKLMNGIVYEYGRRYLISRVDVRIVEDLGVPIRALPEK